MRSFNSKKIVAIASLLLSGIATTAQTVSYRVTENDPDQRHLFIHINPFHAQGYLADISIGYNLQATWMASKHFQFQIDYRKAYLDAAAQGVYSPKGLTKASQLELGGVFNFVGRLKNVNHKVVLHSFSGGGYTYSRSITIKAEARRKIGLRGGFVSFHNNHKISSGGSKSFDYVEMKGKLEDGSIKPVYDSLTFETINITARSTGFYAGIDFKTLRYLIIQAEGYGERSTKTVTNFYIDALFTPSVNYNIKPNARQGAFTNVDVNIADNKRQILGWRFGCQVAANKGFGFNYKFEFGQQPGVTNGTYFINLGLGCTIGLKTKQLPI